MADSFGSKARSNQYFGPGEKEGAGEIEHGGHGKPGRAASGRPSMDSDMYPSRKTPDPASPSTKSRKSGSY